MDTKLSTPFREKIIDRHHLYLQLDEGLQRKLTFLVAPAGYGKSTILNGWIRTTEIRTSWISLTNTANDFPTFLKKITESLGIFDNCDADLLIKLFNELQEKFILIFDDFHHIDERETIEQIGEFFTRLPANIHVYVASRTEPNLSLSHLWITGDIGKLTIKDLHFTKSEIEPFFKCYTKAILGKMDIDMIYDRLEGWAAGMHFVAVNMKNKQDLPELLTATHDVIANYFLEKVYNNQTEQTKHILMKTSILTELDPEIVEHITQTNGIQILHKFEQADIFIQSIDQQQTYKYHILFQEFLYRQLQYNYPGKIKQLHHLAGSHLQTKGNFKLAFEHYLYAESYHLAIELLQKILPNLEMKERLDLFKWIEKIPNEFLMKNPSLYIAYMMTLFLCGENKLMNEHYRKFIHYIQGLSHDYDPQLRLESEAALDYLKACRSYFENDFDLYLYYCKKFVAKDPKGQLLNGFDIEFSAYHSVWNTYMSDGNIQKTELILVELQQLWKNMNNKLVYAHLCIDYGKLLYEKNSLPEAKKYLMKAYKIGQIYNNKQFIVRASLMLAKIDIIFNNLTQADLRVNALYKMLDEEEHSQLFNEVTMFHQRIFMEQGQLIRVIKWFDQHGSSLIEESSYHIIEKYDLLIKLMGTQSKAHEMIPLINRLLYTASERGHNRVVLRLLLHKSYLFYEQKKYIESFQVLEDTLSLGHDIGYVRTFLDEAETILKVFNHYVEAIRNNHYQRSPFVSRIQIKQLQNAFIYENESQTQEEKCILTNREITVLEYIYEGLTNKEIARTLNVALSTVKTHINNLYRKLGVNNRIQAIQRGQEMNILSSL